MVISLAVAVDVVSLLAGPALAIGAEKLLEQVEAIGLWTEMTEVAMLLRGARHLGLHLDAIVAMEAVTLDHGGLDPVAIEDVLEGTLDGGRPRAGRAGDRDDRMFLGHRILLVSL